MRKLTSGKSININLGLLILRIGIGTSFIIHGAPKILGGPDQWGRIGGAMGNIGIDFAPSFWGFMAGFVEFVGGLCLILGIFWVPACILLFCTMMIAMVRHIADGDSFAQISHPLEAGILFLSLIFIGAGKHRLGK